MALSREHPSGRPESAPNLAREIRSLGGELQRLRVYLGASLAVLGLLTLVALGLVAFYGVRLAERLGKTEERLARDAETTSAQAEEMRRELLAQGAEIVALRKSAADDLQAMREAQRKLQAVRDPAKELAALREANEALWSELSSQKTELLESIRDRKPDAPLGAPALPPRSRFRLGETRYEDPAVQPADVKGFLPAGETIHRANNLPARPALLVIEMSPENVGLGEPYRLRVRLVNESNRVLATKSLRLDWSLQGLNTGGEVPVEAKRIDPRTSALLYQVEGQWSEPHQAGSASVTATVTLLDGVRLSNTLEW